MADETYETKARRALNKATNNGAPLDSIKDALVGIGFALLHSATAQPTPTYETIVEGDKDGFKQQP